MKPELSGAARARLAMAVVLAIMTAALALLRQNDTITVLAASAGTVIGFYLHRRRSPTG
jgi:hypothetical protein